MARFDEKTGERLDPEPATETPKAPEAPVAETPAAREAPRDAPKTGPHRR